MLFLMLFSMLTSQQILYVWTLKLKLLPYYVSARKRREKEVYIVLSGLQVESEKL